MKVVDLASAADVYHERFGVGYGISLRSYPGSDAKQIAQRSAGKLPQPVIRSAVAEDIYTAGWTLDRTGDEGHVTLWRAERPTEADWSELEKYFSEPETNPGARPRGGGIRS